MNLRPNLSESKFYWASKSPFSDGCLKIYLGAGRRFIFLHGDTMNIIDEARRVAPELEWVESWNSLADPETDSEFVGATIGLEHDTVGTVTLARVGNVWVSELILKDGNYRDDGGERCGAIGTRAASSLENAWTELKLLCESLSSISLGLEAAREVRGVSGAKKIESLWSRTSVREVLKPVE